jgi:2-polyprenyl-3-methyl-5-hydroxy-6-metoxy-1,4-benzoquinol methylase
MGSLQQHTQHDALRHVQSNIAAHERIANKYSSRHGEIYNVIEQERLRHALAAALGLVETRRVPPSVLDFGCGDGNLTRHLVALGCSVTAADVTPSFVAMASQLGTPVLPVRGLELNGVDLSNIPSNSFDLVATYSVLHHIPDYLHAVKELVRVTAPGGIVFIDHEASQDHWDGNPLLLEFRKAAIQPPTASWYIKRLLSAKWWVKRIRKTLNPRYAEEGDIHVWPDDHIEWQAIRDVLNSMSCEILVDETYLLYQAGYPVQVYESFANTCGDMHMIVARKHA